MNTPFTVWKRPHTLPKGQVKGATPRPPARAASQVRLGVWGLAPAKRRTQRQSRFNAQKKRGYGGATPCTGKTLTKLDLNQQFLHFVLDVKYSIFCGGTNQKYLIQSARRLVTCKLRTWQSHTPYAKDFLISLCVSGCLCSPTQAA